VAGAVVKGVSNCSGMAVWHVIEPSGDHVSLRTLKECAIADGQFPKSRPTTRPK
jgi:hypothetical protein